MTAAVRTAVAAMVAIGAAAMAHAQSQGPVNPGTVVNDASIGTVPWLAPGQATTSDDTYAFAGIGTGNPSQYLKATNFPFSIPASAVILGIEVGVEKKVASGSATDNAVRIVKGGTIGATDRSDVNPWPGVDTVIVYGGSTDLWGDTWTAADINSGTFGAAISAKDSISGALVQVDAFDIIVFYALCGDSIVNSPTEECDDGNTSNGDCCSSTCQFESAGSPCPDIDPCNGAETCDGAGTCVAGTPLVCNDGDICTQDTCTPFVGCTSSTTPRGTCRTSVKGLLVYKDKVDNTKDKLIWKWIKGQATSFADLALPTGTTAYTLCLYAGTAALGDATIAGGPKWSVIGTNKGYKYKDPTGASDGIQKAKLKVGATGKAKAQIKGKGTNLPDLPAMPFALPVTAQLVNDTNNICYTTTFAMAKKNGGGLFKAKLP